MPINLQDLNLFQTCPDGTVGTAYWTCGYDSWIGNSPDFSGCTSIDLDDFNNQLNDTESVPSNVVSDLNNELDKEDQQLTSGDIIGIVDLVENAIEVSTVCKPSMILFYYSQHYFQAK